MPALQVFDQGSIKGLAPSCCHSPGGQLWWMPWEGNLILLNWGMLSVLAPAFVPAACSFTWHCCWQQCGQCVQHAYSITLHTIAQSQSSPKKLLATSGYRAHRHAPQLLSPLRQGCLSKSILVDLSLSKSVGLCLNRFIGQQVTLMSKPGLPCRAIKKMHTL